MTLERAALLPMFSAEGLLELGGLLPSFALPQRG
jgi:hypothetical protein